MKDMDDMQVVVMMGGLGTRLGEITATCPKPLLPVNDRPFFEYELRLLILAGFRRFLFCTGYLSEEIEEHFGDGADYGISIDYSRDSDGKEADNEPKKLLGTGGALRKAYDKLEDDFMLVYADSFMDIDYREVVWRYRMAKKEGALSLMTLLENNGRYDSSNVIYNDGKIELYDKKPDDRMKYIDYGVNVFAKEVLKDRKEGEAFDLSEIQHGLSIEGKLAGLVVKRRFYEIGRPDSYREFIDYARDRFDVKHKAAFLDRDGVLNEIVFNEDTEQLDSPLKVSELKLLDGAAEAVKTLKDAGYYVFIITNQPAAAKGKTSLGELWDINKELCKLIPEIDEVFMCPHHPKGSERSTEKDLICKCGCRKPETGLIKEASEKYACDMEASFMAGDSYTDIQCAQAAGLKSVFIGDLKCDVCARLSYRKPDITAGSLKEAVRILTDR